MNSLLGSLSLKEFEMLSDLPRFSSLRALARARHMEAAQVTRTLQRIESLLGAQLIERAHSGVRLTEEGARLAGVASRIMQSASELLEPHNSNKDRTVLSIGTRGFLNFVFAPKLAELQPQNESTCFRFLDMNPEELKVAEHKRLIQIAIHLGEMEWTQAWESSYAGKLEWSAFARPGHPLVQKSNNTKAPLAMADLVESEFIGPSYWVGNEIKEGEDGYPLPLSRRKISVLAQSAMTAIEIARTTNNIVFAPNIVSKQQVEGGFLARLNVAGTENCFQEVFLSVRTDAVTKKLRDSFLEKMKEVLV